MRFSNIFHSVKNFKKNEGDPLETEKFSKTKNENFQQSYSAETSERDPLRFLTFVLLQNIKKNKGGPLGLIKIFLKSHKAGKGGVS